MKNSLIMVFTALLVFTIVGAIGVLRMVNQPIHTFLSVTIVATLVACIAAIQKLAHVRPPVQQ